MGLFSRRRTEAQPPPDTQPAAPPPEPEMIEPLKRPDPIPVDVTSDAHARTLLEEVGDIQRAVEADHTDLIERAEAIVSRVEGVVEWMVLRGHDNIYGPLIEPLQAWAMATYAPLFLTGSGDRAREARTGYDVMRRLYKEYEHFNPDTT